MDSKFPTIGILVSVTLVVGGSAALLLAQFPMGEGDRVALVVAICTAGLLQQAWGPRPNPADSQMEG